MHSSEGARALYIELLGKCVLGALRPDTYATIRPNKGGLRQNVRKVLIGALQKSLGPWHLEIVHRIQFNPAMRIEGKDWPADAETMIGHKRLGQLRNCVEDVLHQNIPGDLIECGVWRGGAAIFMRGILKAYGDTTRRVWVADSFQGLPAPDVEHYPADEDDPHHLFQQLVVSLEQVKDNFARYGLLDEQVEFLPGWFKDTLPTASVDRLAVLRADGDMYESTAQILTHLYPKLSIGGYCIIDDYGLERCRQATDDYRREHGINEPLQEIDWNGVYWRRTV